MHESNQLLKGLEEKHSSNDIIVTFQVTSDLINVVVGLGRGFQEWDALALCKLLSTVTLHNPLFFPVTLAANQQPLHT